MADGKRENAEYIIRIPKKAEQEKLVELATKECADGVKE